SPRARRIFHSSALNLSTSGGTHEFRQNERRGDDPAILANAAFALSYFGEDIGAMMALVDRALSFNSSFARGWHCSGGVRLIAGLPDLAIQHFENALRLSPRARVGWSVFGIGLGHFASKRFEEALPKLLLAIQEDANFPIIYRYLAACYAHLGRLSEARKNRRTAACHLSHDRERLLLSKARTPGIVPVWPAARD